MRLELFLSEFDGLRELRHACAVDEPLDVFGGLFVEQVLTILADHVLHVLQGVVAAHDHDAHVFVVVGRAFGRYCFKHAD